MRLFLGIPLSGDAQAALAMLTAGLRPATGLRWAAPESWHITLQFLGSASDEQYRCLIERLARLRSLPVSISLGGSGVFDRAGIFYTEVELTPQLAALERRIVAATAACGFVPDSRPYHPHITLARSGGSGRSRELRNLLAKSPSGPTGIHFTASEFRLYESHLSSSGSTYEIRHSFPLPTQTWSLTSDV